MRRDTAWMPFWSGMMRISRGKAGSAGSRGRRCSAWCLGGCACGWPYGALSSRAGGRAYPSRGWSSRRSSLGRRGRLSLRSLRPRSPRPRPERSSSRYRPRPRPPRNDLSSSHRAVCGGLRAQSGTKFSSRTPSTSEPWSDPSCSTSSIVLRSVRYSSAISCHPNAIMWGSSRTAMRSCWKS